MSLHTYVLETDGRRIVVDTCAGNSKDRPPIPEFDHQNRPFLAELAVAGFDPETIDIVVCTHLHVDHVGWNTRLENGAWIPTLRNARYLFASADIDYWRQATNPIHASSFADSVQPVIEAGLVDGVAADTDLTRDVQLRRTPGSIRHSDERNRYRQVVGCRVVWSRNGLRPRRGAGPGGWSGICT